MLRIFREKRLLAKIVLWVLVGMLAVGVLITTIPSLPWLNGGNAADGSRQQAAEQQEAETQLQRLQQLVSQYQQMHSGRPDDVNVLTGYARVEAELGRLYLLQGEDAKGKEALTRSAELYRRLLEQTQDTSLRLELADVYQLLGSYDRAEEQVQAVLQKEPHNLQALAQLGSVYEGKKEWEKAKEVWQRLSGEPDPQTQEYARERLKLLEEKAGGKEKKGETK